MTVTSLGSNAGDEVALEDDEATSGVELEGTAGMAWLGRGGRG